MSVPRRALLQDISENEAYEAVQRVDRRMEKNGGKKEGKGGEPIKGSVKTDAASTFSLGFIYVWFDDAVHFHAQRTTVELNRRRRKQEWRTGTRFSR